MNKYLIANIFSVIGKKKFYKQQNTKNEEIEQKTQNLPRIVIKRLDSVTSVELFPFVSLKTKFLVKHLGY